MSDDALLMTLWNSTLGIGDGQDFATRGYLKALMTVNYPGLRLPPSVSSPLLRFDKENEELADFAELAKPPEEVRMKPLKLIGAGDPRIGKTYQVEAYGMSGERELDKNGDPAFTEVPYTEGAVDPDVDQEMFSTKSTETRCIVIHHDPASICRHYTNLVKHGRAPGVAYVGITAWETSELPEAVAVILSELDTLVVPSRHTKLAMEASGVSTTIVVVPHAFDEERWPCPTDEELDPGDRERFVFYTVATPVERKNLVGLMRAYFKTFSGQKDVVLRIKSSATKGQLREMAVTALEQAGVAKEDRPPIQFFTGKWSIDKIRGFHLDGDCYVSATRGEGFGLCLKPGTLITTKKGVKKIEHISTLDEVLSHDGQWHPVLSIGKRNVEKLVKIEAMSLPDTYLSEEHPVWVARRGLLEKKSSFEDSIIETDFEWIEASSIRPNDYLVMGSPNCDDNLGDLPKQSLLKYSINPIIEDGLFTSRYSNKPNSEFTAKKIAEKIGISERRFRRAVQPSAYKKVKTIETYNKYKDIRDKAKELGYFSENSVWLPCEVDWDDNLCRIVTYYATEGSISSEGNAVEFSLNDYSKKICASQIVDALNDWGLECYETGVNGTKKWEVFCCSSIVARMLIDLCGVGSYNKRLPGIIWGLSFKKRAVILESLIRSDGSNKSNYIKFFSTSAVLAFQTRDLWLSIGIPAGIKKEPRIFDNKESFLWEVGVYGKYMDMARELTGLPSVPRKTKTERTGSHFVGCDGRWLARVKDVSKEVYNGPVYNLQVAGTETFVANGFLVHNCELEAKLCGSRVITTGWGSQIDILAQYDYLIDYTLIPVFNMQGVGCYEPEQNWADPDDDSLVECMIGAKDNFNYEVDYEELVCKFGQKSVGEDLSWLLMEAQRIALEEVDDEPG